MARKGAVAGTTDTLTEIEGSAERLAEWIRHHAVLVVGGLALSAGLIGGANWFWSASKREEGAAAALLSEAADEYRAAMGAQPGSFEIPELANPQAAAGIREEFSERFLAIASDHQGTVAGIIARLEASDLLAATGDPGRVSAVLDEALAQSVTRGRLRGVVLQRLAQSHENAGRWGEAAASYEDAADIAEFPLRHWALADAARCLAEAGQPAEALALFERLEREAPEFQLPELHRTVARELRAGASAS